MQKDDLRLVGSEGKLVAYLNCEIDSHTVGSIRERIDREIFFARPSLLVMDFSAVSFMDSSGLALILGRVQLMESMDGRVNAVGLSEQNMKLVRLSGIEKIKGLSLK